MNIAIGIVFALGTILTFCRAVFPWHKAHPSHRLGFKIAYWSFVVFASLMTGAIFSVLFAVAAEPIVSFVQRVDALERRCPDGRVR